MHVGECVYAIRQEKNTRRSARQSSIEFLDRAPVGVRRVFSGWRSVDRVGDHGHDVCDDIRRRHNQDDPLKPVHCVF